MLNSKEIEEKLKVVSHELCVAFAIRSALRVLPLLALPQSKSKEPFWYWRNTVKSKYLLSILNALLVGFTGSVLKRTNKSILAAYAADKANSADNAAANGNSIVAANAAYSAVTAAATSNAAANAAARHTSAKVIGKSIDKAISLDFAFIISTEKDGNISRQPKNHSGDSVKALDLLQSPLWRIGDQPLELEIMWNCFCSWAKDLDAGFEIWFDLYTDRVKGKPVDIEFLESLIDMPDEIREQGPRAVNAYLATLEKKDELEQLNIVRAIFIGNGAAGKTSIIRTLHNEPVVEGKEKMTAGIDIRTWPVGETGISARFWDFGGQVMAHATHQFFLRERCLYIIVLDARSEFNANCYVYNS